MDKHKPYNQTSARAETSRQKRPLSREDFALASLGLACCISAPEAVRYSALWHISEDGSLAGIASKAGFLIVCFLAARWAATRGRKPLHRNTTLLWSFALLQSAGFALMIANSLGWETPPWSTYARSALLESSIFLFAAFASFYLRIDVKTAITSFIVGVVVAGTVQICAALLPFPAAAGLTLLLAPCSVLLLRCADRRVEAAEAWYSSLPDRERAVFDLPAEAAGVTVDGIEPEAPTKSPVKSLYGTIALLSLIVAAVHLSWRGIQDGGMTSIMVQACAGIGAVLAGNILIVVRRYLEDREVVEFTRLIILPIAIGTLYVASLLNGTLLVLAVIPLNIVYVAVMLLAWLAPFFYACGREPVVVSCDAFLSKRMGVIVGIGLIRDLAVGTLAWLSGALIIVALVGLITLSFAQFLSAKRRTERSAPPTVQVSLDAEQTRNLACAAVADRYRLTPRERDVLELLVRGRTAAYIAEELVISSTTAKTHIKHIYQKTGVQSKQTLLDIVEVELQRLMDRCAGGGENL